MKTVTKADFRKLVYEKVKGTYTVDAVYWIINAVFESMEDILTDGDKLSIKDSFSIQPKMRKEKNTGNFGNKCKIPAHYVPYFKPSKRWKEICEGLAANDIEKNEKDHKG